MRWLRAAAKINLTLHVIERRADGYHELESIVAFAGLCDWLGFDPGDDLTLEVVGLRAREAGPLDENLVVRAARLLATSIPGLNSVASGSLSGCRQRPDLAEALRMRRRLCGCLPRRLDCQSTIPECVLLPGRRERTSLLVFRPKPEVIRGIGDSLGPAIRLPNIFAVLVNPQVLAPTSKVFAAFDLAAISSFESRPLPTVESSATDVLDFPLLGRNDLQTAAIRVAPPIASVVKRLSQIPEARATGMSGSGATCFALFSDRRSAAATRRSVAAENPGWWVEATDLH